MFTKRLLQFRLRGMMHLAIGVAGSVLIGPVGFASAQTNGSVAVIGGYCDFILEAGFECTRLPDSGPGISLDAFDVVVVGSPEWTDPDGVLADFMRSGKGVITGGRVPRILGIDTDPEVQAWIGANMSWGGTGLLWTVATDPIFGSLPAGTIIGDCADGNCHALKDTTGHPDARVLAGFGTEDIGVLRNTWEGGQSVYLSDALCCDEVAFEIYIRSIRELMPPGPVPAVSTWGLVVLTLLLLTAGSALVLRGRHGLVKVRH